MSTQISDLTESDRSFIMYCLPRCLVCGTVCDPVGEFCSDRCRYSTPILRWTCTCGRFITEPDAESQPDPGRFYGVSELWSWDCTRCGHMEIGDGFLPAGSPPLIQIGTHWPSDDEIASGRKADEDFAKAMGQA